MINLKIIMSDLKIILFDLKIITTKFKFVVIKIKSAAKKMILFNKIKISNQTQEINDSPEINAICKQSDLIFMFL